MFYLQYVQSVQYYWSLDLVANVKQWKFKFTLKYEKGQPREASNCSFLNFGDIVTVHIPWTTTFPGSCNNQTLLLFKNSNPR